MSGHLCKDQKLMYTNFTSPNNARQHIVMSCALLERKLGRKNN